MAQIDIDTLSDGDDFDVELKLYLAPPEFKEFLKAPFREIESPLKPILCKSGQVKLPKQIIDIYVGERHWNFENYHQMELAALLYLHFYKDCDEWQVGDALSREIATILEALPHFKSVNEIITYAYINGDLKLGDFNQVVEMDENGAEDVTGRAME
jgi:hypothetical protein